MYFILLVGNRRNQYVNFVNHKIDLLQKIGSTNIGISALFRIFGPKSKNSLHILSLSHLDDGLHPNHNHSNYLILTVVLSLLAKPVLGE